MKRIALFTAALALTAAAVLAQDTGPAPTPTPTPSAPEAPAPPAKKAANVKKRVVLNPPATAVVKGEAVNVRGQPSFSGETLGHLQKGETVTVWEAITLSRAPEGEPARWSQIAMPTNIPVWLDADYVDAGAKTVKARSVNLRGGPGENYSVVGRLEKGAPVNELRREKGWIALDPPTNAYAYVATEYLDKQAPVAPPPVAETPQVVNVAPAPAPVVAANEPAPVAATSAPAPATPVAPAPTPQSQTEQELAALRAALAPAPAPAPVPVAPPPVVTPPPAPSEAPEAVPARVVTREGFVSRAWNIQAPTDYELHDVKTGVVIDYLQPQPQQNFKIYVGTRVTVSGPEYIDQRWPRTPLLRVQSVDLSP